MAKDRLQTPRWLVLLAAVLAASCAAREATPERPAPSAATAGATSAAAVPIPNARTPLPGVLTGGQPTAEQIEEAARAGYHTIVNLRPPGEPGSLPDEAAVASRAGLRYVELPVAHAAGLTEENARRLDALLRDPAARPMIIHCASGNRVGALLALQARLVEGASVDEALELGRKAGLTRLEPIVRERLETLAPSPR